jgi:SAM-dependent methyltransferase
MNDAAPKASVTRARPLGDNESERGGERSFLYDHALRSTPAQIADALRLGRCPADRAFDRYLPDDLQVLSPHWWTPLSVVMRAARWLDDFSVRNVVDIGSGAGKLCVAAALAGSCRFVGLEQRPRLVAAARALAGLFEVEERVRFIEGALGAVEVPAADAYYLFNPFEENIYEAYEPMDEEVELSRARYEHDVGLVEDLLRRAPAGTCVLTYNGFGGRIPEGYAVVRLDRDLPNVLCMWRKAPRAVSP